MIFNRASGREIYPTKNVLTEKPRQSIWTIGAGYLRQRWRRVRASTQSRFVRDGALLATGSLISQILAIFTAPIMARLYDPEAYGLMGLFIAVYGIITVPSIMQYNQAAVLPKEDLHSLAIIKGGLLLGVLMTVMVLTLCFLPARWVLAGTKYEPISPWLPLMALMVLPGCFTTFAMSWLTRKQQFRVLSIARIVINITSTAVGMSLGLWQRNLWGLLVANAVGCFVGTGILAYSMKQTGGWAFVKCSWPDVIKQMHHYRQFPLYATPTQFLTQFSRQTPVLLLTGFSGQAAVGFFNMSNRLLGLPYSLFAESFTQVFFQRAASEYAERGECYTTYRKMLMGMTVLVVPFLCVVALIAPQLFALLLGERWREAGDYSRILCVLFAFQLVCTPLSSMMVIAKRLREDLILQAATTLAVIALMWLGYYYFETITAVLWGYVIAMSLMYAYYGWRGMLLAKGSLA